MIDRLVTTVGLANVSLVVLAFSSVPAADVSPLPAASMPSTRWDQVAIVVSDGIPPGVDASTNDALVERRR